MSGNLSSPGRARLLSAVGAVVAVVVLPLVALLGASPASAAVDAPQVTIQRWGEPRPRDVVTPSTDQPFAGEEMRVATQSYETGPATAQDTRGVRNGWTCTIDFGDGTTGGAWGARPEFSSAPCTDLHTWAVGDWTMTVTVTDPSGETQTTTRAVHVVDRPVQRVRGGVEGNPVALRAPDRGVTTATWSETDTSCQLRGGHRTQVTVRCHDQGTDRILYDTGRQATSGAYVVRWRNGAPAPRLRPMRTGSDGRYVATSRFGTGDVVSVLLRTGDPSYRGHSSVGDPQRVRIALGDGRVRSFSLRRGSDTLPVVYRHPGVYTLRARVTDDDGAVGTTSRTIRVVRRDVAVSARGDDGQTSIDVQGALQPAGTSGRVDWTTVDGRHVVARVTDLRVVVSDREIDLLGPARIDGRRGYRVIIAVLRRGPRAITAVAFDRRDRATVDEQVAREDATVRFHAPVVR